MIELKALQGQVKNLVEDLRTQVAAKDDLRTELRQEYADARSAERIGVTFETWLEDVLDQAAVAWVLGCVFVRFCEDNRLVDKLWIGGPDDDASTERAMRAMQQYIIANPIHNDRHWLRQAFEHLQGLRATSKIFDKHNPVWRFDISAEASEALSDFFRRGAGFRSLLSEDMDTRFLGDLYQELSVHAQKKFALKQTPEFVEEFILDRTFAPALKEFSLAEMSVIDPTCGSGHFLLGAFHRLLDLWMEREPATSVDALVERALGQVTGVDINPVAVAIARFRLVIAALRATGRKNLNSTYPVRVATGDSLLHWGKESGSHQGDLLAALDERPEFAYYGEDGDLLAEYLRPGTYTVVVGNPPYITVKDKVLNERYRHDYSACSGKYALAVPFAQRFFELARRGDHDGDRSGYVGQITANSFMKREFGKKLIDDYFAYEVELTEVIDTSGAYIPGHGTPTVILVGINRSVSDRYSRSIRAILGVRGEPAQPRDAAQGHVWSAIVKQIDEPGSESEWIGAVDLNRDALKTHPWSLSGGGASELLAVLDQAKQRLCTRIQGAIGFASFPGQDEAFLAPEQWFLRHGLSDTVHRRLIAGELVRDWDVLRGDHAIVPYGEDLKPLPFEIDAPWARHLWTVRASIGSTTGFSGQQRSETNEPWWVWYRWIPERYRIPLSITFAEVVTHNHFVLDRGGKVFNRSAPVIKLPEGATDDDHLELLGLLNSSTACFWLRQVCGSKGGSGIGRGIQPESWMERFNFTSTNVERFPLTTKRPLTLSRDIYRMAQDLATSTPSAVATAGVPTRENLYSARSKYEAIRKNMITVQEELDWQVYGLYGLIADDLTAVKPPALKLGERAFEIVLARKIAAGVVESQWFARHNSAPIIDLPDHWPFEYKVLVEKRIAAIESDRSIGLIERPECKRRWTTESWDAMQATALSEWLMGRLEASELWGGNPTLLSVAQLADRVRHDEEFRSVLDLWIGTDQHDLVKTLSKLVEDELVPFLPAGRYKPSGLRKRAQWERAWALQRRMDAGEKVEIDVPPKYSKDDFTKLSYWANRGKLDVPKERFISYPQMGRDGDNTELLGWAGWDHLAQAQALAGVYLDRKTQGGWPAERLLPMLAGLAELEPWLRQWHCKPTSSFPGSPAEFFTGLIDTELAGLGADRHALTELRGVEELA
ncbi:BREX-2 system adenine-specific DNA-methyltransferase PglX [Nocardia sp. NPDC051756]|uniref:BREX-2 system adenine-specific DNA-methyltransferase PglX n=1 Tax=Nocardia sp. NPDC051756 TaxID=3154751 RepID=UPI0034275ED6